MRILREQPKLHQFLVLYNLDSIHVLITNVINSRPLYLTQGTMIIILKAGNSSEAEDEALDPLKKGLAALDEMWSRPSCLLCNFISYPVQSFLKALIKNLRVKEETVRCLRHLPSYCAKGTNNRMAHIYEFRQED